MNLVKLCAYDECHKFLPAVDNHIYCSFCKCKRKHENHKKRLRKPLITEDEIFELTEARKLARATQRDDRNKWLLQNKTFCMFDIETTNLDADVGWILCASFMPMGEKPYTIRGRANDRSIINRIRRELYKFDYIVTWYGTGFDLPFLATRLLLNRQKAIGLVRHIDLYYVARFKFKFFNNRLDNVADGLFGGDSVKTKLRGSVWYAARSHNIAEREKAVDYIVEHCEKDVEELGAIFKELIPFKDIQATPLRRF